MRDLGLNTEFLDNLLEQVPTREVDRVLDGQVTASHSDMEETEQNALPDSYHTLYCLIFI